MKQIIHNKKAATLLMVFMFSIVLTAIVTAYLFGVGILSKTTGWKMNSYRALYVAEAGINRAVANLIATAGAWTGPTTEALSFTETGILRSYTFTASASTISLAGKVPTATSSAGVNLPYRTIDADTTTFWRSTGGLPHRLTFSLDHTISLSKIHMTLGSGTAAQFPSNYTWDVSTNGGTTWLTPVAVTVTGNTSTNVTDAFPTRQANALRLTVNSVQSGNVVNIGEIEIFGVVLVGQSSSDINALDNNTATYWQANLPATFALYFPANSNYSVRNIRIRNAAAQLAQFPTTYTLDVYTTSWTNSVAYTQSGSPPDATATFNTLQTNVNALRINVTAVQGGGGQARIGEIDVPALFVGSICTVSLPGTGVITTRSREVSYYAGQNVIYNAASSPVVQAETKSIFGVAGGN